MIDNTPDLDPIRLGYSFKNINTGGRKHYLCKLYEMTGKFISRLRWKAYRFEKHQQQSERTHEDEGNEYNVFPTNNTAPSNRNLIKFEEELYSILENIEFRKYTNKTMEEMKQDVKQLNKCGKIIVFADKSTNIYKMEKEKYKKLLHENVTKDYKKKRTKP